MTRRALVTGATGFTGQHLVTQLIADGWDVAATSRTPADGVTNFAAEITDHDEIARIVRQWRPEVVFHLAAIVDTVTTPDVLRLHEVNVLGTAAVVEAMRPIESPPRLVFTSSAFVYGTSSGPAAIRETAPVRPVTPYGASKAAAEAIVTAYARETAGDVVVARSFQYTGPGHVGAYAMADWAMQLAEIRAGLREPVIRCGNLEPVRDYLDVRDVASALRALAAGAESGETYNVCSGIRRSMGDLLHCLIAAAELDVEIFSQPARVRRNDSAVFVGDNRKLVDATGWRPALVLEQTVCDLLAFWNGRVAPREAVS